MMAETPKADSPYPPSYYAASRNIIRQAKVLEGGIDADICVVGAGYSGLSAAISLAEHGFSVVVVEAAEVGWGASGRNGGQVVNGLNASLDTIQRRYGQETADFVGRLLQAGAGIIYDRVSRYAIECDLKRGNIYAAYTDKHMRELEAKKALWARHGMDDHELLDKEQIRTHVGSEVYAGGMIDHSGGHMHPLNLALGEAAAFEGLGGRIFEHSPVTRLEQDQACVTVHTAKGRIGAKTAIVCGNAYLGNV